MQDSNQFHAVCLDTQPPIFYLRSVSRRVRGGIFFFFVLIIFCNTPPSRPDELTMLCPTDHRADHGHQRLAGHQRLRLHVRRRTQRGPLPASRLHPPRSPRGSLLPSDPKLGSSDCATQLLYFFPPNKTPLNKYGVLSSLFPRLFSLTRLGQVCQQGRTALRHRRALHGRRGGHPAGRRPDQKAR